MKKSGVLVKLAAATAALTITISALFSLPTDDDAALIKERQPQIIEIEDEPISEEIKTHDEEDQKKKRSVRQSVMATIRSLLVLIASVLMKAVSLILAPILKIAGKPLGIIFSILIDALIIFFIFMVLFGIIWKLIHPGASLKDLYTKRNVIMMAAASLILSIIGNLTDIFPEYRLTIAIISALSYVLVILFLYHWVIDMFGEVISRKRVSVTILLSLVTFAARYFIRNSTVISSFVSIVSVFMTVILIYLLMKKETHITSQI